MHLSCYYTRHHQQRIHRPVFGIVPAPDAAPIVPPRPDVDTGVTIGDLRRHMHVKVWWLDDWWFARITHIAVGRGTVNVRMVGDENIIGGILPRHVAIVAR